MQNKYQAGGSCSGPPFRALKHPFGRKRGDDDDRNKLRKPRPGAGRRASALRRLSQKEPERSSVPTSDVFC